MTGDSTNYYGMVASDGTGTGIGQAIGWGGGPTTFKLPISSDTLWWQYDKWQPPAGPDAPWNYKPVEVRVGEVEKIETNSNEENKMKNTRRLVQVGVMDPDPKVDDDLATLHLTPTFFTSKTEDELKMELDVKSMLEKHNKVRKGIVDEERSEGRDKDVMLRPIKIRDLSIEVYDWDV